MSVPTTSGPVLFAVDDPLAERLERLQRTADKYRATAADYLRAADDAERRARALTAYRHAQAVFVGDQQALELVDRFANQWPGDRDQLVAVVRKALRAAADA